MRKTDDRFMMKKANGDVALADLKSAADDIQAKCSDHIVANLSANMLFSNGELLYTEKERPDIGRKVNISPVALSQMCTRFGVPVSYATKCLEMGEAELFDRNMNTWARHEPADSSALIREYDGNIRGFLSTRYTPCDTPVVLDAIMSEINEDDFFVKGYFLDENRFHVRMIKKEMLNIEGEDLFAGLCVSSSDVGIGSLNINFFVYKKVCSNGLVISKIGGNILRMHHVGIDIDEFIVAVHEAVEKFDIICENICDVITEASEKFLSDEDIEHILTKASKEAQVTKKDKEKIIELAKTRYARNGAVTKWGVINGITEIAQGYDVERQLDLETYAGKLLVA